MSQPAGATDFRFRPEADIKPCQVIPELSRAEGVGFNDSLGVVLASRTAPLVVRKRLVHIAQHLTRLGVDDLL